MGEDVRKLARGRVPVRDDGTVRGADAGPPWTGKDGPEVLEDEPQNTQNTQKESEHIFERVSRERDRS